MDVMYALSKDVHVSHKDFNEMPWYEILMMLDKHREFIEAQQDQNSTQNDMMQQQQSQMENMYRQQQQSMPKMEPPKMPQMPNFSNFGH